MSNNNPSVGQQIYDDTAGLGRITANIGAYVATFIGVIMIIFGLVLVFKKKEKLKETTGTVSSSICNVYNNNQGYYNCELLVDYIVDNKRYQTSVSKTSPTQIREGTSIEIFYDPNNPSESKLMQIPYSYLGWFLIIFAIFIIAGSWIWVYITNKSKMAAALGGTEVVVGGIKSAIMD
jgi:hypothetical protein